MLPAILTVAKFNKLKCIHSGAHHPHQDPVITKRTRKIYSLCYLALHSYYRICYTVYEFRTRHAGHAHIYDGTSIYIYIIDHKYIY